MDLHRPRRKHRLSLLGAGIVCVAFATVMLAQDTSKTETKQGAASQKVQVDRGEVVYVSGNDLVFRMENGEVRHVTVPDSARATVDGKKLSVHELQPGMKLQRTITTTTTPRTVTTVRTIQGKVFSVTPPSSVILSLPDGTNKQYTIPKDQKFTIEGQEGRTAFDLRKGMNISATVVTEVPETVVSQQRKTTGLAPPPPPTPPTPPLEGALLIEAPAPAPTAVAAVAPAPAAPEPPPAKLPKTGSVMPLVGLLGLLCSGLSIGMRKLCRR